MRCSIFGYDIPKVNGRDMFPNPSDILRRVGFRVLQSGWVIPDHLIPYTLINRMNTNNPPVANRIFRFDPSEAERIVEEARNYFRSEAIAQVNALTERAEMVYDPESDRWENEAAFNRWRSSTLRTNCREARQVLADLSEACGNFGIDPEAISMSSLLDQVTVINAITVARAKVYVKGTARLRKAGQTGLATAAEADRLPVYAMADAVRDEGDNETADEIEAAFAE